MDKSAQKRTGAGGTLSVDQAIGARVATWRRTLGLTQDELASAMRDAGLDTWVQQTVGQVEAGLRRLSYDEMAVVAAFFETSPAQLLARPIDRVETIVVRAGKRLIEVEQHEWASWVLGWSYQEPPAGPMRAAIDRLVGKLDRPWAKIWRRRGGKIPEALAEAREKILAGRAVMPGPTYLAVAESPSGSATLPLYGLAVTVGPLAPGVPYVCRDEAEAEVLARMERHGHVRRISAREAYRIRQRAGARRPRRRR